MNTLPPSPNVWFPWKKLQQKGTTSIWEIIALIYVISMYDLEEHISRAFATVVDLVATRNSLTETPPQSSQLFLLDHRRVPQKKKS